MTVINKILFVGTYPPPYGGIASHLHELMPKLVEKGYEVVSLSVSDKNQVVVSEGMKNIYINRKEMFIKNLLSVFRAFISSFFYKKDLGLVEFLKVVNLSVAVTNVVNKEKSDAVFIYDNYNGLIVPFIKKFTRSKVPLGFMIFGDFYLYPDKYLKIKKYFKTVFSETDVIYSSSRYCADSIKKLLDYDFPARVVYVGVDHHMFNTDKSGNIRQEIGITEDVTVFFFLGRISKSMGVDFLLKVADRLLGTNPDIYLIIAGAKGDLSPQVRDLAGREKRVRYFENIPFNKKKDYYSACDVYLAPTMEKHACMGVSIKEAMSCGKPVIASTSGGIPEAIDDGVNGYLIPIKNGALNEDIFLARAAGLVNDLSLRVQMGNSGREKVLRMFTNDETVTKYQEIIGQMLAKRKWNSPDVN